MKSGYDQFFKQARRNAATGNVRPAQEKKSAAPTHHQLSEKDIEAHLKNRMGVKPKKKKSKGVSWKMATLSFLGIIAAAVGIVEHDKVEKIVNSVEIQLLGPAQAETSERKPAAIKPETATPAPATETIETKDGLDHLAKLKDKKKELDAREEEINRMDAELQKQKVDLEVRLKELKETREQISKMLEDRVKTDDSKVETLVQMYSNMRPPQAAKVFETLDEDLAIEILGRMKKKSAADIMNLLKPEKAQVFSEKFAGYKRK